MVVETPAPLEIHVNLALLRMPQRMLPAAQAAPLPRVSIAPAAVLGVAR